MSNDLKTTESPAGADSLDRIVGAFLPPNDVAIAKKWVSRMMDEDPVYREWASKYPGKTDNGIEAELWEVCPGIILNGPVGYWKVNSLAALTFPWKWRFDSRPFPCSNSQAQPPKAD
jgi:hypothetical protein